MTYISYILKHPRGKDYVHRDSDTDCIVWTECVTEYKRFAQEHDAIKFWTDSINAGNFDKNIVIEKLITVRR